MKIKKKTIKSTIKCQLIENVVMWTTKMKKSKKNLKFIWKFDFWILQEYYALEEFTDF